MKQRIPALFTAIMLLLNPQTVRAVRADSYHETKDGGVEVILTEDRFDGFLLVTDGTVAQETLKAVKGVSSVAPLTGSLFSDNEWSARTVDAFGRYGERAILWLVTLKPAYMEILMEYCQDYTLLIDGALDALWLDYTDYGYGCWNGGLTTSFRGSSADSEQFAQQLEVETRAAAFYEEWRSALEAWEASVSAENLTAAEYHAARQEAGILSEYEMALAGEQFAAEILEIYGNAAGVRCELDFTLEEDHRYYDGASVWAHIGDCNMDDAVNAQDAAVVLTFAAAQGAGNSFRFTEEQLDAADVSRDGIINAADASAILIYAANSGAESEASAIFHYVNR